MPYGCDPILTSFISIMTSSSDCSGEGAKRTHQGLYAQELLKKVRTISPLAFLSGERREHQIWFER